MSRSLTLLFKDNCCLQGKSSNESNPWATILSCTETVKPSLYTSWQKHYHTTRLGVSHRILTRTGGMYNISFGRKIKDRTSPEAWFSSPGLNMTCCPILHVAACWPKVGTTAKGELVWVNARCGKSQQHNYGAQEQGAGGYSGGPVRCTLYEVSCSRLSIHQMLISCSCSSPRN